MHLHERIYGEFEITQQVLLDLLATRAMQRLHGVLQHGVSGLIGITRDTTRYEHSLGVMLLVRRYQASLEEQIAALLHDVSHTAFSHVIDYVFHAHNSQGYHDEHKEDYVSSTEIPAVLTRHGYDWCDFVCLPDEAQAERFPRLEQPAPGLCADRLDYFLRDSVDLGLASLVEVQTALAHLQVHTGRFVVDDIEAARWLGYTFLAAEKASWANFREVGFYELTAQAIRRALQIGVLSESDLWGTDYPAWNKLLDSQDEQIQRIVNLIKPETHFVWDADQPTFRVSTKLRTIDPDIWVGDEILPLSEIDGDFARYRQAYLEKSAGEWPMRVIG